MSTLFLSSTGSGREAYRYYNSGDLIIPLSLVPLRDKSIEEDRITHYKEWVPPGTVPLVASTVSVKANFYSTDRELSGTYTAEYSLWIKDSNDEEIFHLDWSNTATWDEMFDEYVATAPDYYVEKKAYDGNPSGSAYGGQSFGSTLYDLTAQLSNNDLFPVKSGSNEVETEGNFFRSVLGGFSANYRCQSQSGVYRVDIPYGSRVYFTGKLTAVHTTDRYPVETTHEFPVQLFLYQNVVQTIDGINPESIHPVLYKHVDRKVKLKVNPYMNSISGINYINTKVKIYILDGGIWYERNYEPDSFNDVNIYLPVPKFIRNHIVHEVMSSQPIKYCVMWTSAEGGTSLMWGTYTKVSPKSFTAEAVVHNQICSYLDRTIAVKVTNRAWQNIVLRDEGTQMGGLYKSLDGRVIWAERANPTDPWKLYSCNPDLSRNLTDGEDMAELGQFWDDPDHNITYIHVTDVPGGGAAALAVYEKITQTEDDNGYFVYTYDNKWLFKFSQDGIVWPDDEDAVTVKTFTPYVEGCVLPVTISWKEGVYCAKNNLGITYLSRKGGLTGSWDKYPP